MEIIIKSKSSKGEPYDVFFTFEDGVLFARCTCKAGIMGMLCKHRVALLKGDAEMLANPDQLDDLMKITTWAKQVGLDDILNRLFDTELKVINAQDKLKKMRKQIEQSLTHGFKLSQ